MTRIRLIGLATALALLGACGDSEPPVPKTPPGAPVPKPPVVEPAPAEPAALQPKAASKPPEIEVVLPAPQPTIATPDKSVPAKQPDLVIKTAPIKAEEAEVPKARLDLSLPDELVEDLKPEEALDDAHKPLLPPLFAPKPETQSPYQLSGKLITNDRLSREDYWDTVEGAQLQIEIKQ